MRFREPISASNGGLRCANPPYGLEAGAAKVAGTDRTAPLAALARAACHQSHRFKENDALTPFGVAIEEVPATPQRIRAALRRGRPGKP